MTQTRFAALFAVAVGEGVAALALIFRSNHEHHQISTSALAVTAGISFVAAGLIALRRRPENRTGIYLAAVGYLWFISALSESNNQWVYTAGLIVSNFVFVPFGALVLAFPSGRLTTRVDRWILRGTVVFALFGQLSDALVNSRGMANCKGICPTSAIVIFDSHSTAVVVESVFTLVGLVLLALVVGVLVVRWRRARPTMRRVLLPVYLAGGGALFVLLLLNIISEISTPVAEGLNPIFLVMFAAIPFAFLLGILRSRLAQGSVATLVVAIGQGTSLRDAIADALGDPSLELAYWLGDDARYVDRDGRAFALPEAGSGRSATIVQRDSTRVGAIVHDDSQPRSPSHSTTSGCKRISARSTTC